MRAVVIKFCSIYYKNEAEVSVFLIIYAPSDCAEATLQCTVVTADVLSGQLVLSPQRISQLHATVYHYLFSLVSTTSTLSMSYSITETSNVSSLYE